MSEKKSRRQFLKVAFVTASGLAASLVSVKYDENEGVKTGKPIMNVGLAEAQGACGTGYGCSGGGGQCGTGYGCSGGGGNCGTGYGCGGQ